MNRHTFAVMAKASAIVVAVVVFFSQDLSLIFNDALRNDATNYVLAVPFIFGYLVYRKRKMIRAIISSAPSEPRSAISFNEIVGALLFLLSLLIYWFGSSTFTPVEYHLIALPIFLSACILVIFDLRTLRQLLFPIMFLFLLVPPPEQALYNLGSFLSVLSSEMACGAMRLFGFAVELRTVENLPTIFVTRSDGSTIPLAVDIACSGIYSQIGFFIFALFVAYIVRDKPWKKTLLFFLGFPLIYLINVLRITIIGVIGYYYGQDIALATFHFLGGWVLIFLGTLLMLVLSERILRIPILARPVSTCSHSEAQRANGNRFCTICGRVLETPFRSSKRDILRIVGLVGVVLLVTSIQVPVFALTENPAPATITPGSEEIPEGILPEISGYTLNFSYRDPDFEALAKQDMALVGYYRPLNESEALLFALPLRALQVSVEIASASSSLHRWEACLLTWPVSRGLQPSVVQIDLRDIQLLQNPPLTGRFFVFNYTSTNETRAVFYWYETSVFRINSTSQQKHVKISLVIDLVSMADLPRVEERLVTAARKIVEWWRPIKTWSQITLLLSQNGDKLITATVAALSITCVLYALIKRKEKGQSNIAYRKLSGSSKQVIDAVYLTGKRDTPTLDNISKTLNKMTGRALTGVELLRELSGPERIGLLRREIMNKQDEPVQAWRTDCSPS